MGSIAANLVTDITFDSDNVMYLSVYTEFGKVYKVTDNGANIDMDWLVRGDILDSQAAQDFSPRSIVFDKDDNLYMYSHNNPGFNTRIMKHKGETDVLILRVIMTQEMITINRCSTSRS